MHRTTAVLACLGIAMKGMVMAQVPAQGERDRAMSYLHATRKQFLDTVSAATPQQWTFRPAPDAWSMAEIAEHLAVTEEVVMKTVEQALAAPAASAEKKAGTAGKDDLVMRAVPNRSRKVQAPEPVQPTGQRWATREALVAEFKVRRDRTIAFIEKTNRELRAHIAPHPALGPLDSYQWILFLAAHTERHVRQMRETMGAPGVPQP
ncbi:MAG: DinB family protein [Bryobacterales bacterium]|nr:DinB family protein [Bryobacterales bacterium]